MMSSDHCLHNIYSTVSSFFFTDPATTEIYTLSLHDALPIFRISREIAVRDCARMSGSNLEMLSLPAPIRPMNTALPNVRSEEHTSELQSQSNLVCRLLLEKKKAKQQTRRCDTRNPTNNRPTD